MVYIFSKKSLLGRGASIPDWRVHLNAIFLRK